jgi:hypothetical protein
MPSAAWERFKQDMLADEDRLEGYRRTREVLRQWVISKGGDPDSSEINMVFHSAEGEDKVNVIGPEGDL